MMRSEPSGRLAAAVVLLTTGALLLTGLAVAGGGPTTPFVVAAAESVETSAPLSAPGHDEVDVSTDAMSLTSAGTEAAADAGRPRAASTWVAGVARATGIPQVALRGYANATLALRTEDPGCGLDWTTLAGIGAIESGHGTHGSSVLGEDGRAFPSIIGPALDGGAFAAIPATELSTTLDGDAHWQHAVGPLQFLPDTWDRWGPTVTTTV